MRNLVSTLALVACVLASTRVDAQEPPANPAAKAPDPSTPPDPAAAPATTPTATTPSATTPSATTPPEPTSPPAPSSSDPVTPRIALRHNLLLDSVATGVMGASLLTWGFLKPSIGGFKKCVICDGDAPGETNGLDDFFRTSLKRDDITPPATASHIISYGIAPAMGFALTIGAAAYDRRIDEAPLNCLLVIEASLVAVITKEAFTAFIRRERPFVHALEGEAKEEALASGDPLESFPGGHTASIMAITASSAVISTLRGYRLAPLIWVIGSTVATVSMYLRIAADQHYFTDNVAGAVIGGVVGAGIPLLFHGRIQETPSPATAWLRGAMVTSSAVPGGRVVGLGWAF